MSIIWPQFQYHQDEDEWSIFDEDEYFGHTYDNDEQRPRRVVKATEANDRLCKEHCTGTLYLGHSKHCPYNIRYKDKS